MNHLPPSPPPPPSSLRALSVFSKIREDVGNSRCTAGVVHTGGNFTAGIVDTGCKSTAGVNDTGGHIFPEMYTDRGDTGGKFVTSVNDAGGQQHLTVNRLVIKSIFLAVAKSKISLNIFPINHRCNWHRRSYEYLCEYSKKCGKGDTRIISGRGERWFMTKTLSQKCDNIQECYTQR